MITLLIISFLAFTLYNAIFVKKFGVPTSLSGSYYVLEVMHKNLGWLFTVMCWLTGGLILPVMLQYSSDVSQFLAFFACASLLFIGAAPQFKINLTGSVHYISAGICFIAANVWVYFNFKYILFAWILVFAYLIYAYIKTYKTRHTNAQAARSVCPAFFIEIATALITYVTVLILLCNG